MTDRSDAITEELLRIVGNLDSSDPIGRVQHQMLQRLRDALGRPEVLELMAQAHDQEDAAQKGEPSPWRPDLGADQDHEWRAERRDAMLCALKAVGLA